MSLNNRNALVVRTVWAVAAVLLLVFHFDFGTELSSARSAPPSSKRSEHVGGTDHADHAAREAALRKIMNHPVDIYFDVSEVETKKPSLVGVRFVDLVDVTGKELLRFGKGTKEHWLIDPDMVLAFHVVSGNRKTRRKRK